MSSRLPNLSAESPPQTLPSKPPSGCRPRLPYHAARRAPLAAPVLTCSPGVAARLPQADGSTADARSASNSPEQRTSDGGGVTPFVSAPSSPTEPLRPAPLRPASSVAPAFTAAPAPVAPPAASSLATQRVWAWLTGTTDRLAPWTPTGTGVCTSLAAAGAGAGQRADGFGEIHVDGQRMQDLLAEASEPQRRSLLLQRFFGDPGPTLVPDRAATEALATVLAREPNQLAVHALQLDPLTRHVTLHPPGRHDRENALGLALSADEPLPFSFVTLVRERARSMVDGTRIHLHFASLHAWDAYDATVAPGGPGPTHPVAVSVLPPAPPPASPRAPFPTGRGASPRGAAVVAMPPTPGTTAHRRYVQTLSWRQRVADFDGGEQRMPLVEAPRELGVLGTLYRTAHADFLLPIVHLDAEDGPTGWYKPHRRPAVPLERI